MLPMTPKPHDRLASGSPTAIAAAKAAARVPTSNSHVDRCGWSRIDTLSLVTTSPYMKDATDEDGDDLDEAEGAGGGGGGSGGIFLTQLPPEVWEAAEDEVGRFGNEWAIKKLNYS